MSATMDTLSECLGYISMSAWLGAQFPQVVENYRRQSVEGLALPFLANWLLGDITNLVGCLLTHQLPFQTYLAIYFVFVDCTLLAQYFYYTSHAPPPKPTPYTHRQSASLERSASRYRALSVAAAQVAATAAHLAHHDGGEPDDAALAHLAESFESLDGGRVRRKTVAWGTGSSSGLPSATGTARAASLGPVPPPSLLQQQRSESEAGGRPSHHRRRTSVSEDRAPHSAEGQHVRRSSRTSKRGASVVFLSAWALFSVGTLLRGRHIAAVSSSPFSAVGVGRVLGVAVPAVSSSAYPAEHLNVALNSEIPTPTQVPGEIEVSFGALSAMAKVGDNEEHPPYEGPSMERIIGRIFAWACTTLYLTSRLPQIWKNYVRKSVEGLSMYLFIFAFMGNFFYVSSILTSPSMRLPAEQVAAFLRESLPYLLGSAGTLMFDVTIVLQSRLYKHKGATIATRGRSNSLRAAAPEERAGLLEAGGAGDDD